MNYQTNFEKQNYYYTKVFHCQICRDQYHEALFCYNAVCVFCKSKDHISYFCKNFSVNSVITEVIL